MREPLSVLETSRQGRVVIRMRIRLAGKNYSGKSSSSSVRLRSSASRERDRQITNAEKQIADAEKQIADLQRQLTMRKKNSTNSSKPPSSDGLAGTQRRRCSPRKK